MIKKLLIFILLMFSLLFVFILSSCDKENQEYIIISSVIVNKNERHYSGMTRVGKATMFVSHHHYYFYFEEIDRFEVSVSTDDYNKYEVGDFYLLTYKDTDTNRGRLQKYFFDSSITYTREADNNV